MSKVIIKQYMFNISLYNWVVWLAKNFYHLGSIFSPVFYIYPQISIPRAQT